MPRKTSLQRKTKETDIKIELNIDDNGEDDHRKAESIFKAFGKAMKIACSKEKRILKELPSTKGLI